MTRAAEGVHRVLVVGAGSIGASWAQLILGRGLDVIVVDPDARRREQVRQDLIRQVGSAVAERLTLSGDLATAAADADFVIEAVPEKISLKHEVFAVLDAVCPSHVVLSSSTSALAASAIQEACAAHPQRVVVAHPFNPPHIMPLVEVVGGSLTTEEVVTATMATMRTWGKEPIRLTREVPGHVANRLQAALWREAYDLVASGVASAADVDQAIASGPGLRWALLGPFATQHLSGGPGGFAHIMEHLGPSTFEVWKILRTPEMTPEVQAALIASVEDELRDVDTDDLMERRDAALHALLTIKQTYRLETTV